ncbi:SusC/RagA family TonB-linked outer membrane protein [Flavobacterium sp.]|uniref:SusC/RagA family TonB-linked outer membrane protein n=1 Tax=Flavobacterium sp. TaxID=239 RepID=UPI0037517D8E
MRSKFKWIFTLLVALTMQLSFAQEKTVKGVVTDASGPMPGVNVVVKGTQRGVSSGFDGAFSIKASEGEVLVFSFMGMNDVLRTVDASGIINVKMQDNTKTLGEVVIVALGQKKSTKAVTYAATTLKGESFTEARESNLVNALAGKAAGVNVTSSSGSVGSSSRVVLRGNSTITGNNNALFVVDGVPFDNSTSGFAVGNAGSAQAGSGGGRDLPNGVASINPDDIESITVLKGPNAAALYGIRAAQGVIVITTKKGKKNQALGVSINSNITFSNPLVLPSYQNSYGQSGRPGDNYFEFTDGSGGTTVDGTDESWGLPLDAGLSFVQWDSFKYGGKPSPWVSHPDNVKDFFETGISQSNSVSLSGGGENSNFRFSFGNSDEKGMVPFTDFKKFNVSAAGGLNLGKSITANVSVNYFKDKSNNLPTVGYSGENAMQQFIWSARQVNFSDLKDWRNFPLATAGPGAGSPLGWNTAYQNNPYWVLENNKNTYDRDRVNGKFSVAYKMSEKFTVTGGVSTDTYSQLETTRQAFGSANTSIGGATTAANGSYTNLQGRYSEINGDIMFNYAAKLSENIGFSLNAGANKMSRIRTSLYGEARELEVPGVYNLSNVRTGTVPVYSNNYREQKINSVLGYGQLSYKTWFFLDFTARNDWSSLLAKGNNSFFYPSVSGSLVLSDIFDTKSFGLDLFKLRGGWSKVGSTGALAEYNINDVVNLNPTPQGNFALISGTEFNNGLQPESNTGTEFGLDLKAFNDRLRFGATYYNQKSEDLLLATSVEPASGFNFSWQNAASMTNKGYELELGITALKSENFSFNVDLNFAQNKNTVNDLGGLDAVTLGGQWGLTLQARPGMPYGVLVGKDFQRDSSGQVIYVNGIPQIDNAQKVLGDIAPDWTGGANFTIKYKNIEFATLIDTKVGGDVHSMSYAWGRYSGVLEETLIGREGGIVGNGVMSDGAGGYVTNNVVVRAESFNKAAFGNNIESSAIFDATFVKLRQMNLGYSIPKKFLKGTSIDNLKLSVVGRNLAILYKKAPHIDPETGFSSANGEQGQEFGQLPSARSIGFNVSLKF